MPAPRLLLALLVAAALPAAPASASPGVPAPASASSDRARTDGHAQARAAVHRTTRATSAGRRALRAPAARAARNRRRGLGIAVGRRVHGLGAFPLTGAPRPAAGGVPTASGPVPPIAGAPVPGAPAPDGQTGTGTDTGGAPAIPGEPSIPATGGSSVLGVQVTETPAYRMLLSRPTVSAGAVRIQLRNNGEDAHNALLVRTDGLGVALAVALTLPGASSTQTVTLAAGGYRLFCTLLSPVVHEAAGMRAAFTVTP
jgi:hypothetical protein